MKNFSSRSIRGRRRRPNRGRCSGTPPGLDRRAAPRRADAWPGQPPESVVQRVGVNPRCSGGRRLIGRRRSRRCTPSGDIAGDSSPRDGVTGTSSSGTSGCVTGGCVTGSSGTGGRDRSDGTLTDGLRATTAGRNTRRSSFDRRRAPAPQRSHQQRRQREHDHEAPCQQHHDAAHGRRQPCPPCSDDRRAAGRDQGRASSADRNHTHRPLSRWPRDPGPSDAAQHRPRAWRGARTRR